MNSHKAKTFEFSSYTLDTEAQKAIFSYMVSFQGKENLTFAEEFYFPKPFEKYDEEVLDCALQNAHLMIGISYFKMYFPQEIVCAYELSKKEADFWNAVYQNGLGEYMYTNKLSYKDFPEFKVNSTSLQKAIVDTFQDRVLMGIGGGKDSIVALELVKDLPVGMAGKKIEQTAFVVETNKASNVVQDIIATAELDQIIVSRTLDPKVFEKNENIYNGHIPVSGIFAFVGLLTSVLYNYRYLALSNGQTSNYGNVEYEGRMINHAWSKSQEFEELFNEHIRTSIVSGISLFSPVRPFYEYRIVEMFVQYPQYFAQFTSCNRSFKVHKERSETLWCGECDKCAYMFTMLAAHLSKEELLNIFYKNLLDDESLLVTFQALLGLEGHKPFDCVGEPGETQLAFIKATEKYPDAVIVQQLLPRIAHDTITFQKYTKTHPVTTTPTPFIFLGMKKVAIVGYGKEGKSAEQYLQKNFPELELTILDQKNGEDYLEKLADFDGAIKSPGIPKDKITIQYTTPTNLFFAEAKERGLQTIGITGTVGKSNTTALTTHILNTAGKKAIAMGNIGEPALNQLETLEADTVAVLELSSYQLDDIRYSPDVAVILQLLDDHKDYHGSLIKYHAAKQNITRFQTSKDILVYNQDIENIETWTESTQARTVLLEKVETESLLPPTNVHAAYTVAREMGIGHDVIIRAINSFKGLSHRMEYVGEFQGIYFYDDARSSTPESTIYAIEKVPNLETIFLGGLDRGYDFAELRKVIAKSSIKNIVIFPDTGKKIIEGLEGYNVLETRSMEEAVAFAFEKTEKGKSCLLSTASPSYSVWSGFEEKGGEYQGFIKER